MRIPVKGEQLVSADGEVWIVLRCHLAGDDPSFFAVDLIQQQDLKHTSRSVNLTWDEFDDFCRKKGIVYPPA
ncbi:MAG TPA: hypothetical protein VN663_09275 [Ramlibacter sp.]|jgi:hypothetical protein|nr:hypothetical protein [Ramlibacter sp.]